MAGVQRGNKTFFEDDIDPEVTEIDEEMFEIDTDTGKFTNDEEDEIDDDGENESLEEEMAKYSRRAKAKIKELEEKLAAQDRARFDRDEEMMKVAKIAKDAIEENQKLRAGVSDSKKKALENDKKRIEAELEAAQEAVASAYDEGDGKALAKANAAIGKLTAELVKVDAFLEQASETQNKIATDDKEEKRETKTNVRQPDPKAVAWAKNNPWFGDPRASKDVDPNMTNYALLFANNIERNEGVHPGSDEYYKRIDAEMKTRFPEKFKKSAGKGGGKSNVAPVSRNTVKKPRSIQISAQTVKFLEKNKIDPKEYAKEYVRVHGESEDE
jgi:hypothetical protein